MSISIRTLKIVIGILVLVSMILSMVPMFGMAGVGRAINQFSRQAAKLPRGVAGVGVKPIATHRTYVPQAVQRPTAVPAFNGGAQETYDFSTLGGMPTFPEAPKPIIVTPPVERPQITTAPIADTLFTPGVTGAFSQPKPVEKAPVKEVSEVFSPAVAEAMATGTTPEPVQEVSAVKTVEPIQDKAQGSYLKFLKQEIPQEKPTEPAVEPAVQEAPAIEAGEAVEIRQPHTGQITSTPADANTYELIEQRAEAVHGAPVVDVVKSEQGTLKPGEIIIDTPFKIDRIEVEPAIAVEQRATRTSRGELGNLIKPDYETANIQQVEKPAVEQSYVVEYGATPVAPQGILKSAEVIEEPVAIQCVEQPEPVVAVERGNTVAAPANVGVVKSVVPDVSEPLERATTKEPDVAVIHNTMPSAVSPSGAAVSVGVAAAVTPVIVPAAPAGVEEIRRVVIPAPETVYIPADAAPHAERPVMPKRRERARSMPAMPERPRVPGEPRRMGIPPKGPDRDMPPVVEHPRAEDPGHGRPEPRRPRPARPVAGLRPVYYPADPAVIAPVVPPLAIDDLEDEIDSDGGIGRVPFPPAPRPRKRHGLPPARGVRTSPLDDLEDKVIRDKNKVYGDRFDKAHRPDSLVQHVLPLLSGVPSSVEQSAHEFINAYDKVDVTDATSYGEFINAYNDVMATIKREREAAAK